MNTYEELAVLEQGEDGAIVSIRGQGGPCVLLGPGYVGHLAALIGRLSDDSLRELQGLVAMRTRREGRRPGQYQPEGRLP
jgi:hypothetical protein